MNVRRDSYCGLDCGACPVGLANELDDSEGLQKMAIEWELKPSELRCGGCKGDITVPFCARCAMRVCAVSKGHEFCFQCTDYPCEALSAFKNDAAPHHSAVFRNLERIRETGIDAWLKHEAGRWSCPSCGRRFSWYEETCSACGAALESAVSEEKQL